MLKSFLARLGLSKDSSLYDKREFSGNYFFKRRFLEIFLEDYKICTKELRAECFCQHELFRFKHKSNCQIKTFIFY